MIQIFIAALLLSIIHASIPNHWLPLIAIGKTEKWSHTETMFGTFITGIAHTLSTVLIGIVVGFFGYKLSSSYDEISTIVAPAILVVLGIIYLILDFRGVKHHHHFGMEEEHDHSQHHHHDHSHHHEHSHEHGHEHKHIHAASQVHMHEHPHSDLKPINISHKKKTKWAVLASLSLGMFLTPCAEIEAYYFQASTIGWTGIWIVSSVYTVVTIAGMLLLVYLGMRGMKNIQSHFMEEHEKRITGIVLILVGLMTWFVKF